MRLSALLLAALAGCHGFFGDRTDAADRELNSFAEARQRAATFYDGGDYVRAAAQYREALKFRKHHFMSRLGLAYSLMRQNLPLTLHEAEKEFVAIGERRDPKEEVKRVYGLGLTYRSLGAHYARRARLREEKGQAQGAAEDLALAREYAHKGIAQLRKVFELDKVLAREQAIEPLRVSASLTPDAHLGIAHCEIVLIDRTRPEDLKEHLDRARENLVAYARIAADARKFWELKREELLVLDPMRDASGRAAADPARKKRYEQAIANTIREEVAARRILLGTLLYANLFEDAIAEAGTILGLDPTLHEVVLLRGRAYQFLQPPDYRSALRDLKEYRSRLPLDRLTDELVQVNREIKRLEREVEKQEGGTTAKG